MKYRRGLTLVSPLLYFDDVPDRPGVIPAPPVTGCLLPAGIKGLAQGLADKD
jgi:hypothetical protein